MARARTNVTPVQLDVLKALDTIRAALPPYTAETELGDAVATMETFIAIAMRVLQKTNPSKIQSEARTVALMVAMRMAGK